MQQRARNPVWCIGMLAAGVALVGGCARTDHDAGDDPTLTLRPRSNHEPSAGDGPIAELDAALPRPSFMDAALPEVSHDGSIVTEPSIDGGAPARDAEADAAPVAFNGEVVLEVLTKPTPTSPYQPGHLLAIWVEDDAGNPIKVLGIWGASRRSLLTEYSARVASKGPVPLIQTSFEDVDTVTGATQRRHELRVLTWDMTDHLGQPVPQAQYSMLIELADDFAGSHVTSIPLLNGSDSVHVELEETIDFGPIKLTYMPPRELP